MIQFKHPGVYTQEIRSGARTISNAPTSVTLFVGPTKSGIDGRRVSVRSFGDFQREFGGFSQTSSLSYSIAHFFANGGGDAVVIRVPAKDAKKAKSTFRRDGGSADSIVAEALSSGVSGNRLWIEVDPFDIGAKPFDAANANVKLFNLTVLDQASGRRERFGKIETASASARFANAVINDEGSGSKLVSVKVKGVDKAGPPPTGTILSIGALPAAPADGKLAKDVKAKFSVAVLADDGTADAASVADKPLTIFPAGALFPKSKKELVTRLIAALNAEIRASAALGAANAPLEGLSLEGQLFEGDSFVRIQAALPSEKTKKRVGDATIKLADETGGGADGLLTLFVLAEKSALSARIRLGATYPAASPLVQGQQTPGDEGPASAAGQPDTNDFKSQILALDELDPFFNILCLPDLVRPLATDPTTAHHGAAVIPIYGEAARICKNKHAFLLIDPPPNVTDVVSAEAFKTLGFTFQSSHSAAYFPNIRVDDPLEAGAIRSHPPSGAIAGVFARTDGQFGVWQAPAGTEAVLSGVYGPSVVLSDEDHGVLNPLGLNCIRHFPIYNTVSFGSRTVDGSNAQGSEWKYIPVRRTANHILRSLSEALRWAVHKPNGEQLWSQLRLNVTAFMHGLFRQGAFKGVSARDAYFVLCDASTTTSDDIDNGVVNIVIGFAPLKPAEFVVISLRQIVQPSV